MRAVHIEGVTKTYRLGVGRARVREMAPWPVDRVLRRLFPRWWTRDTFNALDDVSVMIPGGSSVGIVGHNGAGKTTLLKVIAGVTSPNAGTVAVSGRMAALIDILVGFHPEMTGRENAYLLGAVHGFGRRSMAPRIDRIFEFAEIDDVADTPLKRYSSGMVARLGFAVISALEADILLVDEVLAVGDAAFQRKCIQWLDEYRAQGGTLLFVSHNLALVRNMTERVIWLDHGKLTDDGLTGDVLGRYAKAMERRDFSEVLHRGHEAVAMATARGLHRWGAGGARVEEVNISEPSSEAGDLDVAISYEAPALDRGVFCIGFVDEGGREIGAAASPLLSLRKEKGAVRCSIRPLPLRPGIYFPVVAILSPDGLVRDRWRLDRAVVIDGDGEVGISEFGPVDIHAAWAES
jgi:lipopolysaccharide transport system ATP-binding protein